MGWRARAPVVGRELERERSIRGAAARSLILILALVSAMHKSSREESRSCRGSLCIGMGADHGPYIAAGLWKATPPPRAVPLFNHIAREVCELVLK